MTNKKKRISPAARGGGKKDSPAARGRGSPREIKTINKSRISRGKKVWRIFHFQQRFEMDEYRRQGGLDYIRMFVTATTSGKSNESTDFFQQLAELRHYYSAQYYFYFGIFWALGRLTATKEDWLRGYLVDADLKPLNGNKIAARLQIDKKQNKQALAALKSVGLIEYIDCPQFTHPDKDKEARDKEARDKEARDKEARDKKARDKEARDKKARDKKDVDSTIPEHSGIFQNISKSFKKTAKPNIITKANAKALANDNLTREITNRQIEAKETSSALEGQEQAAKPQAKDQGREATAIVSDTDNAPTTTPPIKPKEADTGSSGVIHFPGSLGSDKQTEPQQLGNIVKSILHRYNPEANEFADKILEIIKPNQGKRDHANFASGWQKACYSGLSPPQKAELWNWSVKKAREIMKHWNNRKGKPAAVFRKAFNGMLTNKKVG